MQRDTHAWRGFDAPFLPPNPQVPPQPRASAALVVAGLVASRDGRDPDRRRGLNAAGRARSPARGRNVDAYRSENVTGRLESAGRRRLVRAGDRHPGHADSAFEIGDALGCARAVRKPRAPTLWRRVVTFP